MSRFSIASYSICAALRNFSAWKWRSIARQWVDKNNKLLICDRLLFSWSNWFDSFTYIDLINLVINVAWKLENFLISSFSQTIWAFLLVSFLVRFSSDDSIFASFRSTDSIFLWDWFFKSIWNFVTSSDVWSIASKPGWLNWSNSINWDFFSLSFLRTITFDDLAASSASSD